MSKFFFTKIGAVVLLAAGAATAQTPAAPLAFDVASIKTATPDQAKLMSGQQHVGLKVEGNRVDIGISSLSELIGMAYKVKYYQIQGPDWLTPTGQRFDILAKMPEGSNKDQVPEMLQALLADRFKLTIHRSSKENQVYALVIAKTGIKMKETPPDVAPTGDGAAPADTGMKASGNLEKGMTMTNTQAGTQKVTMVGTSMHVEASKMPMAMLAESLSRFVDHPVVDMTGLKGNYQIALDISQEDMQNIARSMGVAAMGPAGGAATEASEPGSSILTSVQQLGLKLEPRKTAIDLIVIDHIEKLPTEN